MTKHYEHIHTSVYPSELRNSMKLSGLLFDEVSNLIYQSYGPKALIHVAKVIEVGKPTLIQYTATDYDHRGKLLTALQHSKYFPDLIVQGYTNGVIISYKEHPPYISPDLPSEAPKIKTIEAIPETQPIKKEEVMSIEKDRYLQLSGFADEELTKKSTTYIPIKRVRYFARISSKIEIVVQFLSTQTGTVKIFYPTERSASIAMNKFIEKMNIEVL